MSQASHRDFLERSATRSARRAQARAATKRLDREDVAKLRIQTVEPWKRIVCLLAGAGLLGLAGWMWREELSPGALVCVAAIGAMLIVIAAFGWKKPVERL